MNYTAANDTNTNQYRLVTHLYQYFGALLGCSAQSNATDATFRTYQGDGSMSKVHRFMNLTTSEVSLMFGKIDFQLETCALIFYTSSLLFSLSLSLSPFLFHR